MANLTEYGNYSMIYREYYCSPGLRKAMKISILIFTIPISIMAFFGNALIIPALRKLSSLHSPSKILISCLACTDLGVGLISNPLLNGYYFSRELQELSLLLGTFLYRYYDIMRRIFVNNDCNKCRQTSCSITGAKVQAGCNCEASNGPCCHYMAFQHPYRRGGVL